MPASHARARPWVGAFSSGEGTYGGFANTTSKVCPATGSSRSPRKTDKRPRRQALLRRVVHTALRETSMAVTEHAREPAVVAASATAPVPVPTSSTCPARYGPWSTKADATSLVSACGRYVPGSLSNHIVPRCPDPPGENLASGIRGRGALAVVPVVARTSSPRVANTSTNGECRFRTRRLAPLFLYCVRAASSRGRAGDGVPLGGGRRRSRLFGPRFLSAHLVGVDVEEALSSALGLVVQDGNLGVAQVEGR